MDVTERLSFFAALFNVNENPETGMWLLYITVFILSVIVFNLGFARKLPVLKNVIIYFFLALGCTFITFLAVFLPVAEGLVIACIVLGIYKFRLKQSKDHEGEVS